MASRLTSARSIHLPKPTSSNDFYIIFLISHQSTTIHDNMSGNITIAYRFDKVIPLIMHMYNNTTFDLQFYRHNSALLDPNYYMHRRYSADSQQVYKNLENFVISASNLHEESLSNEPNARDPMAL